MPRVVSLNHHRRVLNDRELTRERTRNRHHEVSADQLHDNHAAPTSGEC